MEKSELRHRFLGAIAAAEGLSGARVTVHDISGFLHKQEILLPGDAELVHHGCSFCQHVRDLPGGRAGCVRSDLEEGVKQAQSARQPVWHRCHAGMEELAFPLFYQEKTVAVVFIGQCRVPERPDQPDTDALRSLGADAQNARAWHLALPAVPGEQMERAALLLQLALEKVILLCPADEVRLHFLQREYSLAAQALRLIHRTGEGNTIRELAEKLFVSPSALSRAFRREYGVSLREYMDDERLRLAKRLLREGRQKTPAIAANVGFQDVSAFLRWFHQRCGMTPAAYRSSLPKAEEGKQALSARTAPDYAALCEQYLRENFRSPLRIGQLAASFDLSPDYLNRLFRQRTGETLTSALWKLRLEAAREELARTQAPIGWIAGETGFASESALDQRFRAVYGLTPGEYRRKVREGKE